MQDHEEINSESESMHRSTYVGRAVFGYCLLAVSIACYFTALALLLSNLARDEKLLLTIMVVLPGVSVLVSCLSLVFINSERNTFSDYARIAGWNLLAYLLLVACLFFRALQFISQRMPIMT